MFNCGFRSKKEKEWGRGKIWGNVGCKFFRIEK